MVKILDCTLRDGGHVNNWNFSDDCILKTFEIAKKSDVDYFEVGYNLPECIKSAEKNNTKIGIMIDAKNIHPILSNPDFVRLACYPEQIQLAINAVENYYNQGFEVFLHLMTADKFENFELLKNWKNKNILTSIYFADSFGSFLPNDVEKIYKKLKDCGFEQISFHAHNNLQLAFTNTIKAIELGAYSVDGSVFGMGRSSGNLPIELLFKYLNKDNSEYLSLIKDFYIDLYKQKSWGYSYDALIGGLKNIHPSKVKQLNDGI